MAAHNPEVRQYVRRALQPYIDNALKKEASKGLPKPEVGTIFEVKDIGASVIYTRIGYLELNNPTGKKVYHQTLQAWCKSIQVDDSNVTVGL